MTDEEIEVGAAAFCRTLRVAGGRTSYDYAVRAHLSWFEALLARGLGWAGIIRILSAAGVHRDGGLPLSRGHLSSVYWRQVNASRATSSMDPVVPKPPQPRANEPHKHLDPITSTAPAEVSLPVPVPPPVTSEDLVTEERRELRAFMRRAAALRRTDSD